MAVKQLRPDRELLPAERSRFLREAQVQGQLEHPSIVPVYDIDRRPDGSMFFTMRRVVGRTLEDILDDLRRGVPEAVARYTQRVLLQAFATVCLAVDYAHSRGVIHRVPSIFVSRLRSELTRAQERELLQAWQFRRLASELVHASPR